MDKLGVDRLITELQEGLNVSPETITRAALHPEGRAELHRKLDYRLDILAEQIQRRKVTR